MSKKVYNNQTGFFRDIDAEEDISKLHDYEVVVNALPKPSCTKCHGRGYIGRDIVRNELMMCRKCFRKITDFDHARERVKIQMEKIKAEKAAEAVGDNQVDQAKKIDYLPTGE